MSRGDRLRLQRTPRRHHVGVTISLAFWTFWFPTIPLVRKTKYFKLARRPNVWDPASIGKIAVKGAGVLGGLLDGSDSDNDDNDDDDDGYNNGKGIEPCTLVKLKSVFVLLSYREFTRGACQKELLHEMCRYVGKTIGILPEYISYPTSS